MGLFKPKFALTKIMGFLSQESYTYVQCIEIAFQRKIIYIIYIYCLVPKGVRPIGLLLGVICCAFRLKECFVSFVVFFWYYETSRTKRGFTFVYAIICIY